MAEPENDSGAPGVTTTGETATGGFITTGVVIDTEGAIPVLLTIQVRSTVSREDWPAVSCAITWIRHSPS